MISQIIISASLELRVNQLVQILEKAGLMLNHPDLLYLEDEEKLGVEAAKKIRQHLSLKPYSAKGRAVVLESAQKLSLDAQNALLKTLEEPPLEAVILLGVDKADSLLPTVLSRCQVVYLDESEESKVMKESKVEDSEIERLINSSIEDRFTFIEKLEEKEEFLKALQLYFQQKMRQDPKYLKLSKLALEAEEWQKSNVNLRAILEYLMLEIS